MFDDRTGTRRIQVGRTTVDLPIDFEIQDSDDQESLFMSEVFELEYREMITANSPLLSALAE